MFTLFNFKMSHYFSISYGLKFSRDLFTTKKLLLRTRKFTKKGIVRNFSVERTQENDQQSENFVPFLERIDLKRSEAKKSIIVQVQSANSFKELHNYCSSIGKVEGMFHYTSGVEPLHFIIVEFEKELDAKNIMDTSNYLKENMAIPTHSHFLWFRAANRKLAKLKLNQSPKIFVKDGTKILEEADIREALSKCEEISDQIKVLHSITKLNEVGTRLRFLTAHQVEKAVSGMFPYACAYPFGSSVNGYGKMGCDLDLILRLEDKNLDDKNTDTDSRLVFHCKPVTGTERSVTQRHIETLGDIIHLFLPGCGNVRRILQARVPIIKYHQQLTDVECDVSMTNMSGVHMSDFLYIMGEMDDRVRPLVFCIRKWANIVGITNSSPGRWITNFSLTLLVLAFLQRPINSPPVLPSLNYLTKFAGSKDEFEIETGITCKFLRDIRQLKYTTQNKESMESLLLEFFVYYSQFDFSNKAICLNETIDILKPEYSPLYIVNPLERGLNVSKNVSLEEVERFRAEVKNAAWILESRENNKLGLLSIFEHKKTTSANTFTFQTKPNRLMKVSDLFEIENEGDLKETNRKQNFGLKKKSRNDSIILKNRQR
ncbi:mitochondrial poly(A) polymerase [Leptinotarsa decemlineata]|uniref:mitochondrial poly(A) polymerase n=1 Tax=Leptinotarsa decemlineata TaxID=7539 RepID=UPI003D308410